MPPTATPPGQLLSSAQVEDSAGSDVENSNGKWRQAVNLSLQYGWKSVRVTPIIAGGG